ncbi:MAG: FixH family protein [Cyclobacteriaceae bacterium]|jgi:hypothetical protein|nr:FixH family protein [Cyclobacteriaceae bacterium]
MKWIVAAFVVFALFMGALVFISLREDVNLVSENYYAEELKHQDKIDQQNNANQLAEQPQLSFVDNAIKVSFPYFSSIEKGQLHVLRPSNNLLDQTFELSAMEGDSQLFELKVWEKGLYRVSLTWTMEGKEYYFEKLMVL